MYKELFILILILLVSLLSIFSVFKEFKKYKKHDECDECDECKKEIFPKTFFIDIDGTIVPYPKYKGELDNKIKIDNYVEELLPGAKDFFDNLNENDVVIFTTGRNEKYRKLTERTLKHHNIKYKHLIMDLPVGKRYLINDTRNVIFQKSIAINLLRDKGFGDVYDFNETS
jgi:predicted secreted acid phosphatase